MATISVSEDEARHRIGDLYDEAIRVAHPARVTPYFVVSDEEATRVRQETQQEIAGFTHVLDNSAIRHIMKKHGDPVAEERRGQIAVTRDDFLRLIDLVKSPDTAIAAGTTKQGRRTIRYTKGALVYVEEIRTGRKHLAGVTLYKMKERQA